MSLSEGKRVKLVYVTALVFLIVLISGAFQFVKLGLPVQHDDIAALQSIDRSESLIYRITSQLIAIRHTSNEKTFRKRIEQLDVLINSLDGEYRQIQRIKPPAGWKKIFYSGSKDRVADILPVLRDQMEAFILKAKSFNALSFQHPEQQDSLVTDISRLVAGDLSRVFTQSRVLFRRRIDETIAQFNWVVTLLWGLITILFVVVGVVVFRSLLKKVILMNEVLRTEHEMMQEEKQELEKQVQEKEKAVSRSQQLLDLATDGHLTVMKDNRLMMNRPFVELLEVPEGLVEQGDYDKLRQFLMLSFIKGEDFGRHFQELNKHVNDSSYFTLNHKDGRQMECRTEPIFEEDNVIGRVWVFRDITEYLSFKSNRQSTGTPAKHSATPPAGIASIFHELNGTIIEADINALQLFGFSHDELLGKNVKSLFPGKVLPEMKQRYRELSKRKHSHFDTRFVRQNGKVFSARVAANLIKIHDTRAIHLLIDLLQFQTNGHQDAASESQTKKNLTLEPSS